MINHVVSLDVAKKLKEYLPEDYKPNFIWRRRIGYKDGGKGKERIPYYVESTWKLIYVPDMEDNYTPYESYPAPLLSEMLNLLPREISRDYEFACGEQPFLDLFAFGEHIGYTVTQAFRVVVSYDFDGRNYATAAALLYIHLKERGLV